MDVIPVPFIPGLVAVGLVAFVFVMMFLVLVLILFMTPAGVFLGAKLKKSPVMAVFTRSGQLSFMHGKNAEGGVAEVKKIGVYSLTEESSLKEKKSGVPIYLAPAEFASTMPPNFADMIQQLKKQGLKFKNSDELLKEIKKRDSNWKPVNSFGEPLKVHELNNMWPYNINPSFIESKIQFKVLERMKSWNFKPQTWIIVFAGLLFAAIAFMIIKNSVGGGQVATSCTTDISPETLQLLCEGLKSSVGGLQG